MKEGDTVEIIVPCSGNRVGEIKKLVYHGGELYAGSCSCKENWKLIKKNNNKIMSRTITKVFISESDLDDASKYNTLGEVLSDNDDILSDGDTVLELSVVKRFKVSKPKVGLEEIKPTTKKK